MKNKSKFIILALIILISVIGISYAFFEYYKVGTNQKLIFGEIYLKMNEGKDTITLTNVFPETKEAARKRTDNQITFTISGINTTTNKDIWYEIMLNEGNEVEGRTRFNPEDLVFDLVEVNEDKTETFLVDAMSFGDIKAKRIWVETVNKNTTSEVNKTYKLRMWLSEDVFISDTNPNATYDVETFESSYASVKVSVYGDFVEKHLSIIGYVTYDMSSLGLENPESTPIYGEMKGTITTEVTSSTLNKFLGWSTTIDGEVVYQPGDDINASDVIDNNLTLYPVIQKEYLVDKITSTMSLTTADSDGTRFVYGNTVDNNYVWYSGKLWRIVSIDKDGNIKLVTQGNITALAWNTSNTNNDYSTGQIRKWLNEEFLDTLENKGELIVDSVWNYNISTVTEKVGLLTISEFLKAKNGLSTCYLNNGYYWWTMTSLTTSSNVAMIYSNYIDYSSPTFKYGVRPSINLKSGIIISGGTGEKNNPYTIEGDKISGKGFELLSNRISGEYIKFNDIIYRIVGVENGLTKVIMGDYSQENSLGSICFNEEKNDATYNPSTGVGKYLNDWYNGTSINNTYKNMIAVAGIKWYIGPEDGTRYDYTLSKTGTMVETPIGLGYYGEMFAGQFGDGYASSSGTWLISKFSSSQVFHINYNGYADVTTVMAAYLGGVRPSFYLKSNVVIGDTNGDGKVGTGMPHDPYEIVQSTE